MSEPIRALLVEDNPADVELTEEALSQHKLYINLDVVVDGAEAVAYLRARGPERDLPYPDLIILDLNVPRIHGSDILSEIKSTPVLKRTPVVVLTSSSAETDIVKSYELGANCYVGKPLDFSSFQDIIASLENFWFTVVRLPHKVDGGD